MAPSDKGALVAYTLSDSLWAHWALRELNPSASARIEASLLALGHSSNGFHDQIFHVLPTFHGHITDPDRAHGRVLGAAKTCTGSMDGALNLSATVRHPDYAVQPQATDEAMAGAFIDFAVYYAFHHYWNGSNTAAAAVLRDVMRAAPPAGGGVWYCAELGLVLDKADNAHYLAWRDGSAPMTYCPFKQALILLAARTMGLVLVSPAVVARLEQRVLESQAADGSFCMFVRLDKHGDRLPLPGSHCGTAETTSMVMLSILATASNSSRPAPSAFKSDESIECQPDGRSGVPQASAGGGGKGRTRRYS